MKQLYYQLSCGALFIIGCLFYCYQESWIIITSPFCKQEQVDPLAQQNINYKSVTLYAWHNNDLKQEASEIIYSRNTAQNIKLLLNTWLLFLEDEHVTEKQTQVISVALSPSKQEALISLNQPPFEKSWSTYAKLMWTESMLKTLKENNINISSIRLLVHHEPLQDDHLNFAISWPLVGFLQK